MAKIFACGDIANYENKSGYLCSDELASLIRSSDYAACNFEAPVIGQGKPIPKSGAHLHQAANTLAGLKAQGFDLLLLANNHILDYGREGLESTFHEAKKAGLDVVGAGLSTEEAYQPLIKQVAGLKIGIINACEAQFGVIDHFERKESAGYAWINHPKIDTTIIQLKKECDFVLVFAHAGLEDYSIPQKQWRVRYKHFCDLGADVIIGSHPHVPQGYEQYKGALIFYSLGNFYFDYGFERYYENHSYAVMLDLVKGQLPAFKAVHHKTRNSLVCISEEPVDIDFLSEKLGDGYKKEHDEMNEQVYEKFIKRKLINSASKIPFDGTFKGTIKEMIATLLGRRKYLNKPLDQLHFMRNETYYYAARHALELKAEKK